MRVQSWLIFCLSVLWTNAWADGYRDFNAGITASERWESNDAVTLLTRALSETGLPEYLRPTAYLARGREYFELKRYDAALADFSAALRLKPNDVEALVSRCTAYDAE